jgi:carboxyl-terminal processing protease
MSSRHGISKRSTFKRIALFTLGGVLLVVMLFGVWVAYHVPKPWRSGWSDAGGDCSRSHSGSPLSSTGATIAADAGGRKLCGYGFALQREAGSVGSYTLTTTGGTLEQGEVWVSVASYDGWTRIDRAVRRIEAPADLGSVRLDLPVAARARVVEIFVSGRPGARFSMEGIRLTEAAVPSDAGITGTALYDEAMALIDAHALNASQLPPDFRQKWQPPADATAGEARLAIREVLKALGDRHSFLIDPAKRADLPRVERAQLTLPRWELLEPRIGYVEVPGVLGVDHASRERYRVALWDVLRSGQQQGVDAWVVDLRRNHGGNMWPMLNGLEPLLRNQSLGYFRTRDDQREPWLNRARPEAAAIPDLGDVPVAVLTSARTASSGEAVALAFRGRPNTRSFGKATSGLSTANAQHALKDGTLLVLTGSVFLDRAGNGDGSPIQPDEAIRTEIALQQAINWLKTR